MRVLTVALAAALALSVPAVAVANQGILLLAHDGSSEWTTQVRNVAAKVDKQKPVEVAFGLPTKISIGLAVDRLAKRGATEVIAVPFFLSVPVSEDRLTGHPLSVRLAPSIAEAPLMAEIIFSLADETSRQHGAEVLLLLGYGSEDAGTAWKVDLAPSARRLNLTRRFGSVMSVARPDKLTSIEQQNLRGTLEKAIHPGRPILVVSVMNFAGGPPSSIEPILKGFSYAIATRGVLSDDRMVQWVLAQVSASPR